MFFLWVHNHYDYYSYYPNLIFRIQIATFALVLLCAIPPTLVHAGLPGLTCDRLWLYGYDVSKCGNGDGLTDGFPSIESLESTRGVIKSFDTPVKSLKYWSGINVNATDCNPIQFTFYSELGMILGWEYITPGEIGSGCIDFKGITIASYSGSTMLIPVPNGLSLVET